MTGVEDEVKEVPLVESSIQPVVVRFVLPSAQAKEVTSGIKVGKTTKVLGKMPPPVVAVKVAVWVEEPAPTSKITSYNSGFIIFKNFAKISGFKIKLLLENFI